MSYFLRANIYIFILFLCVLKVKIFGDKIEQSIYKKITGSTPCVTLLNATHQIGCKSKRKGNVGVLHYIESDKNLTWLLNNGNHAPYVALFTAEYFTDDRLKKLVNADKVAGALVLYDSSYRLNGTLPPRSGFSPEYPCPNENFGLYAEDLKYGCNKKGSHSVTWNNKGSEMMYRDYDVPVFALYNPGEISSLINCYKTHNEAADGGNPDFPLCGVEMLSFMFAAKDTPTCMRKNNAPSFTGTQFCDALGDSNVWGTLFPYTHDKLTKDDVILVTAKLDSTAFFHDVSIGADNDATGFIVLLAAAEALGDLKRNGNITTPDLNKNQKHIMFSFFQGEVWDYIGSSRMVYDMGKGIFPCDPNQGSCKLPSIDLSNIAYYLELNQVGIPDENALWAHRDPESTTDVSTKTTTMFDTLSEFGTSANLSIKDPSGSKRQPLPPASFQRFLLGRRAIPGLVITDHKASYTNTYYNSRFDDIFELDVHNLTSNGVKHLTSLATTVAKTLYQLAYNETKEDFNVSPQRVKELVDCFLVSPNCTIFKAVSSKDEAKKLSSITSPWSRYVGPNNKVGGPTAISTMTRRLLAYFTGIRNVTCVSSNKTTYILKEHNKECVTASVYFSSALSPAFLGGGDYDSTRYSTWTESRWGNDIGMRMFLIADPTHEAITLAVGIMLTLVSIVVTVFMYRKAEQLFTPGDCVFVINDDMQ